jgi:hypothetical protein
LRWAFLGLFGRKLGVIQTYLIALEANAADQLPVHEDDDPAPVQLKEWSNRFPMLSIRTANRASLAAYIVRITAIGSICDLL